MRELSLQPITAQWYARAAVEYFFHFRLLAMSFPRMRQKNVDSKRWLLPVNVRFKSTAEMKLLSLA
jgi:hypothetical protein